MRVTTTCGTVLKVRALGRLRTTALRGSLLLWPLSALFLVLRLLNSITGWVWVKCLSQAGSLEAYRTTSNLYGHLRASCWQLSEMLLQKDGLGDRECS